MTNFLFVSFNKYIKTKLLLVYSFKNAFAIRYIFVQVQLAKHCQDHVKTWPEIFLITSNQVANVSASIKSFKSSAMSHLIKSCIRHKPGGYHYQ